MSSEDDFRRIQEVTEKASAKLTALRNDLNSKLETFSTSEKQVLRDKIRLPLSPHVPPQATRLASIAASLSPSSYSSPNSNRAGGSTVHFPINTPPMVRTGSSTPGTVRSYPRSVPVEDPVTRMVQSELTLTLEEFEKRASELLATVREENKDREKCFEEFLVEITNRETAAMDKIVESVRMIGADDGSDIREELIEQGFDIVLREMNRQKTETEKIRKLMVSDKLRQMFGEVFARVESELAGWRSRIEKLSIDSEALKEEVLSKLRMQIEADLKLIRQEAIDQIEEVRRLYDRPDPNMSVLGSVQVYPTARTEGTSSKLAAENAELKSLVRKMKLSLCKWRIDYLNHAKSVASESSSRQVVVHPKESKVVKGREMDAMTTSFNTPRIDSTRVSPGGEFPVLSESLMKMWSAVPPSGEELVQFLVNMEAAVNSGGKIPLSSVYDYECKKNVAKLPLAQMAAQREFMLSTDEYEPSEMRTIDNELLCMIMEYERTYKQRFVFTNVEDDGYARSIERHRFDRSGRDP